MSGFDTWRIAVLGDGGAGKTALSVQTYDPTIEDSYCKQLVIDSKLCFIEVIDTAGQEEYHVLRNQMLLQGDAFVLVYSVTSRISFERLSLFHRFVKNIGGPHSLCVLVGTQCDRVNERVVSVEDGVSLSESLGCPFIETSAKTGENVDRPFIHLVRTLRASDTRKVPSTKGRKKSTSISNCVIM